MQALLSERDAAIFLGVSRNTVLRWRNDGWGPDYLRLTGLQGSPYGAVRYKASTLRAWLKRTERTPRQVVHKRIWGDKPYRVLSGKYATPAPAQSAPAAMAIPPTPGDPVR
jgi:hypothetical protein